MLIKVCGMRDPENIRALKSLNVDMMGLIFCEKSPRRVRNRPSHLGIMPDSADKDILDGTPTRVKTVGVFVDEMPQTVITQAYDYRLDYLQLHGDERRTYIENLKRTLVPDILPDIKIIKAISVREADDVKRWREYEGCADMLLFDTKCETGGGSGRQFDWGALSAYDGDIPFLLSGGIGPDDAERVRAFRHEKCVGVDLNSRFETAPAVKDIDALGKFIEELRK